MIKTLTTVLALAVASVTSLAQAQPATADIKAGEGKIAMCIGCHGIQGYQASFPEVYKVPKISGQGAPYIVAALDAYKKGERKHPTMRAIADSLSEQDMADIAAYYADHGQAKATAVVSKAREPSAQVAKLIQAGACISCHGEGFAKPTVPSYPKVAGQHADYLYAALKSYKVAGNPQVGRNNAVMVGVATQFTNSELKALAQFISSLPGELQTVPQPHFRLSSNTP